ncbi:hypothetical protein IFM89_028323 [Coptis chinensis]|uniref:CCHC-type domain-containing protein n=1 Tax=Coptis chinensis TaxID=261450 RepID=A0A835I776_9MAGN|nr:hypothetical protein IFM89_028323 [Coptis chinensis]
MNSFSSPNQSTFCTPSSSSPQSPPWSPFPTPPNDVFHLITPARIVAPLEPLSIEDDMFQNINEPQPFSLIKNHGSEPYIGLEFRSEGEAYDYYRVYAKENGFSIRKSHVERSRVDHTLISRKFVCVRQGFRSLKDKRYQGKVIRHRQVTRVDCRAAMIIKRRCGKWIVHRFLKDHNHDLQTLYKTQCVDMEDTISRGQKILDCNMVASDSIQEPQPTTCVQESLGEDVITTDTRREDKYSEFIESSGCTARKIGEEGPLKNIQAENIDEHTWMMDLNITVPDPPRVKLKSRPVSSRIKLGILQAQKKKRTCGTCKETGHYTRTCPKGSVDQSQASKVLQGPVVNSQASSILQGAICQSQSSTLSLRSTLLQGSDDHSETSDILHGSLDQSQTSMMLQEHFGQPQIFAML